MQCFYGRPAQTRRLAVKSANHSLVRLMSTKNGQHNGCACMTHRQYRVACQLMTPCCSIAHLLRSLRIPGRDSGLCYTGLGAVQRKIQRNGSRRCGQTVKRCKQARPGNDATMALDVLLHSAAGPAVLCVVQSLRVGLACTGDAWARQGARAFKRRTPDAAGQAAFQLRRGKTKGHTVIFIPAAPHCSDLNTPRYSQWQRLSSGTPSSA